MLNRPSQVTKQRQTRPYPSQGMRIPLKANLGSTSRQKMNRTVPRTPTPNHFWKAINSTNLSGCSKIFFLASIASRFLVIFPKQILNRLGRHPVEASFWALFSFLSLVNFFLLNKSFFFFLTFAFVSFFQEKSFFFSFFLYLFERGFIAGISIRVQLFPS